jgi:hypothetical protein
MLPTVEKVRMARKMRYVFHWVTTNRPSEPTTAAAQMNMAVDLMSDMILED